MGASISDQSLRAMERYTHGHAASVVSQHGARTVEDSAQFLLPFLRPHVKLLDVGCGPGSITRGFASRVSSVVGVDSSAEVIATAKAKAAERDSEERTGSVTFEVASAYELPYEDETFDVVFAHQLLQHLSEPLRALQEMRRVCKAGGLVAAREVAYSTMQGAPVLPGLHRWREVYMMTARRNGGEPDAGLYLKKWMNSAGFTSLRFTTSTVTHSDSGTDAAAAKRFFGESWATRTLETFGPQAVAFGFCSAGELDEMAAAWRSWAQDSSATFVYVNGEVVAEKT
ncbi:Uncharacterized methyltransferase C1B3.06c [Durusdinium trenchii]|uniref:Uncharacterized methyltransferase C1B3.06c n=1 Tax=Durusdinium trenchii TaxID=1381693 RepID=A0ABP0QYG7_9DINO